MGGCLCGQLEGHPRHCRQRGGRCDGVALLGMALQEVTIQRMALQKVTIQEMALQEMGFQEMALQESAARQVVLPPEPILGQWLDVSCLYGDGDWGWWAVPCPAM